MQSWALHARAAVKRVAAMLLALHMLWSVVRRRTLGMTTAERVVGGDPRKVGGRASAKTHLGGFGLSSFTKCSYRDAKVPCTHSTATYVML